MVEIVKDRKIGWLNQVFSRKYPLVQTIIEGRLEGKRGPGRKRVGRLDVVKLQKSYSILKKVVLNI